MKKLSLAIAATALSLGGLAPVSAYAHRGLELRTFAPSGALGATVRSTLAPNESLPAPGNPEALIAGAPVSPRQSCALCHDYDAITSAYHFQLGADERVDADGDGFKDDLGKILAGPGGVLEGLPTLYNITSPGQFGAW